MTAGAGQPGAKTTPSPPVRVLRALRSLAREQRVTALAAVSLWITLFLPWYTETGFAASKTGLASSGISLSAWSAFGLVQAFVLFVSVGVLALLFARGEGRGLHLPGGDGANIVILGGFTAVLIFYGMFDKPGGNLSRVAAISTGVSWGIFLALFAAIWLAWSGRAMRRAEQAPAGGGGGGLPGGPERRLTRRERRGGGETPESARWVEPAGSAFGDRREESRATQRESPQPPEPGRRRDDPTQLELELQHDRDE